MRESLHFPYACGGMHHRRKWRLLCAPTARVLTGAGLRPALRIVKDKHTSFICAVVCPQSARVEVAMVVNS